MSGERDQERTRRSRVETGVPGLDALLGGGLIESSVYLLEGSPGAGKTILANQIAFHLARQGERVLVVTLIAESHGKLLEHLRTFSFVDEQVIAREYTLLSGFNDVVSDGLDGLLGFITRSLHELQPTLFVLDGFATARECSESPRALSKFLHALNALVTALRCTTLLLAPMGTASCTEHTQVDGLIELKRVANGLRRAREIEVHKMRGGRHLTGQHVFAIGDDGIRVYPRLETIVEAHSIEPDEQRERLSTGVEALDAMTGGGLVRGSATSVLGAPGVGKTLLGLSFLGAGAAVGERGAYFGFYEARERIVSKAQQVGLDLARWREEGMLELAWQAPLELYLDEVAEQIEALVERHRAQRLFLDGLEGFAFAAMHPERLASFLTALSVLLRAKGVTTLFSEELPLFGQTVDGRMLSVSALVENVILMRYFEHRSELRRLLSIMKLRESGFDPSIREFHITERGIVVGEKLTDLEGLLGGTPQPSSDARGSSGTGRPRPPNP